MTEYYDSPETSASALGEGVGAPTPLPPELDRISGPDHRAEVTPNAFWRTFLQVGPAAALSLLLILPQVLQSIVDGFGRDLPPEIYAWLVGFTATITLLASIAAKVMARPDVQAWLEKYAPFFSATKK